VQNLDDKEKNQFIKNNIEQIIINLKIHGGIQGLGKKFIKVNTHKVIEIEKQITDYIYIPFEIYTNEQETEYYFVNENDIFVFGGYADEEGLYKTIIKDITTLNSFINFDIAAYLDDYVYLNEFIKYPENILKVWNQMMLGASYLIKNHPEKFV
jgi:hypothetical protein